MKTSALIVAIYGLLCLIGGMIGYFTAGSFISMIVGGIGGLIVLMCGVLMLQGKRAFGVIALVIALAFGGRFVIHFFHTHKIFPDLVMVLLSLIGAIAAIIYLLKRR